MILRPLAGLVVAALLTAATPPSRPSAPPAYGPVRYADSLTSVNDRCAVSHAPLNLRVDPVYVNGQPVGFC